MKLVLGVRLCKTPRCTKRGTMRKLRLDLRQDPWNHREKSGVEPPIQEMVERTRRARLNSESALLDDLLTLSEMIFKLTTLGMIAGLESEHRDKRYAIEYSLIRADR